MQLVYGPPLECDEAPTPNGFSKWYNINKTTHQKEKYQHQHNQSETIRHMDHHNQSYLDSCPVHHTDTMKPQKIQLELLVD